MDGERRARLFSFVKRADRWLASAASMCLLIVILARSRANIAADSIDYYAILQRLTSPAERPIVRNLHFVEQRSPGYPLAALAAYGALAIAVDPLVSTETVTGLNVTEPQAPPGAPPSTPGGDRPDTGQSGSSVGSEHVFIPPAPLLIREVPFKDFYIASQDSWFRWKPVLALSITSYLLLFLGLAATARGICLLHPSFPAYSLIAAVVITSPVFIRNILDTPLYATLSAFGASALFVYFFLTGRSGRRARDLILAGAFLGFLVLTRLELSVFAITLVLVLFAQREWRAALLILIGPATAALAWAGYNQLMFGSPLHLGILRGDINVIVFNPSYMFDSLFHPSSGILVWSSFLTLGLVGLVLSESRWLRTLGLCSFALVALYLVRVPVMYGHVGEGLINIGGIPVTAPSSQVEMRELIRSDINRYVTVLIPAAVVGLRDGASRLRRWRRP